MVVFICQGFEVYMVFLSEVGCVLGLMCLGFDVSGVDILLFFFNLYN